MRTANFGRVVAVVLLLTAAAMAGDDICQKIEYAELKDMTQTQLLQKYCNYHAAAISLEESEQRKLAEYQKDFDAKVEATNIQLQNIGCGGRIGPIRHAMDD